FEMGFQDRQEAVDECFHKAGNAVHINGRSEDDDIGIDEFADEARHIIIDRALAMFIAETFEASGARPYYSVNERDAIDAAATITGSGEKFVDHELSVAFPSPLGAVKGRNLHLHPPSKLRIQ
ncbi:MAG: hypothetical protein ABFC56_08975, partial [Clostridiaceae bacterium]